MWKPYQKYGFEGFSEILKHRIDPSCLQFCRAHQTVSTRIASDSVNKLQWRRIFWERTRTERKIDEKWRQRSLFELEYLKVAGVLEQYPKHYSIQNWMGYNLMQSFLWKSLMERERSQKLTKFQFRNLTLAKCLWRFPPKLSFEWWLFGVGL